MGVWKSNGCSIVYLFIFTIIDFVSVTVLQGHGHQYQRYFAWEVSHYDFKTSLFDLWVCSLVRTVVILGCLFGILYNGTSSSTNRSQKIRPVIAVLAIFMWAFPIIKLLCVSEYRPSALNDVWFWVHFAWAVVAAIVFYANFCVLCRFEVPDVEELVNRSRVNINATDDEEQRPLLAESREADKEGRKEDKDAEKTKKKKSATVWRLLSYSKPDVLYLAAAFVFMQVNAAADIFTPYYTGRVIQGITIDKSHSMFIQAIVVMSILSVVAALSAGCRGGFFKVAMSRLSIRIRNALFSAISKQEIGFFDTTVTGDITSRLTSDASTMADALGYNANIFMRNCLKAIGTCAFMFAISWRMSLQTLVALPIIMGVSSVYGEYYQSLAKQVQDSLAVANQVAEETCSSMRTVRSFANEKAEADMYANRLQVTYRLNVKEAIVYAGYAWSTMLFQLSLLVATLYYGGHLVLNDLMTGGQLIAFILYQIELGNNMNEMADVYTGLMQAVGASEKVFEIIDREPKILNDGDLQPEELEGKLEFKDVSFTYPSRPDSTVLTNVSFNVQPGEVVALVGPSGGGKSTCINLLEHFYEAAQGQVMLDGRPVQDYDHKYLHQQISLVGQEPVLYARSVQENIAYGMDTVDTEQVKRAAQLANAHQFITEMNDQYETETGEKGLQLSGGQKQRVAIARALIRNPRVLLLDEATSALDSESEHVVQEAIYGNLKGRTVVIIAHRLSTVERADRIVVIEKGSVVEQGSHAELLKSDGMYARLVRRQLLGFDVGFSDHLTRGLPPDDPVGSFKSIPETKSSVDEDSSLFGSPRYGSF